MMIKQLLATTALSLGIAMVAPAQADTLLMQQVHKEKQMAMPTRGMTMAQVERRFGAPLNKLPTRGGDAPRHPPINRWQYAHYIVYFERNRVIHSVINPPTQDSNS
ncbi:MAG: hypothetical protein WBW92_03085 [Rhodanobacteraceae bacterium]